MLGKNVFSMNVLLMESFIQLTEHSFLLTRGCSLHREFLQILNTSSIVDCGEYFPPQKPFPFPVHTYYCILFCANKTRYRGKQT